MVELLRAKHLPKKWVKNNIFSRKESETESLSRNESQTDRPDKGKSKDETEKKENAKDPPGQIVIKISESRENALSQDADETSYADETTCADEATYADETYEESTTYTDSYDGDGCTYRDYFAEARTCGESFDDATKEARDSTEDDDVYYSMGPVVAENKIVGGLYSILGQAADFYIQNLAFDRILEVSSASTDGEDESKATDPHASQSERNSHIEGSSRKVTGDTKEAADTGTFIFSWNLKPPPSTIESIEDDEDLSHVTFETAIKKAMPEQSQENVEKVAKEIVSKVLKDRDDRIQEQAKEIERLRHTMENVVKDIPKQPTDKDVENTARDVMSKMLEERAGQIQSQTQEIEHLRSTVEKLANRDDTPKQSIDDVEKVARNVMSDVLKSREDRVESQNLEIQRLRSTVESVVNVASVQKPTEDDEKVERVARDITSKMLSDRDNVVKSQAAEIERLRSTVESLVKYTSEPKQSTDDVEKVAREITSKMMKDRDDLIQSQAQEIERLRSTVDNVLKNAMPKQSSEEVEEATRKVISTILAQQKKEANDEREKKGENKRQNKIERTTHSHRATQDIERQLDSYREMNARKKENFSNFLKKKCKRAQPTESKPVKASFFGEKSWRSERSLRLGQHGDITTKKSESKAKATKKTELKATEKTELKATKKSEPKATTEKAEPKATEKFEPRATKKTERKATEKTESETKATKTTEPKAKRKMRLRGPNSITSRTEKKKEKADEEVILAVVGKGGPDIELCLSSVEGVGSDGNHRKSYIPSKFHGRKDYTPGKFYGGKDFPVRRKSKDSSERRKGTENSRSSQHEWVF